jgi:3-oxoadipate enol-lactonase
VGDRIEPDGRGHVEVHGRKIFWERFGRGERDAVCLLNGLAMHTKAWYPFLEDLRPDRDVVLYDYVGQGESDSPDAPVTVPELADGLAGVLDHLEIERVHPVGVSYGGFVALDFARIHRDRVATLTLSGILLSRERSFDLYQDLSLRFYAGGPDAFRLYTRYLYEKIFGEPFLRSVPPGILEEMRARFEDRYRDRVHSLVRLTEAQDPFFERLDDHLPGYRAIDAPTWIVAGEHDRAIPVWMQRKLCDVLPRARFDVLPETGHVTYLERRAEFFGGLRAFLDRGDIDFAT